MKRAAIITRSHIISGARRGGYVSGLKRHSGSHTKNAASPTCMITMNDERACEKCGAKMTMRELISHARHCANGTHWFETLRVLTAAEERKVARMFLFAK